MLLVPKMTLRQELEVRELQSAVFKTFMLKEQNLLIAAVKGEVGSFVEKSKLARTSGGSMPDGELHAYAWAAVTGIATQQVSLDALKETIVAHRAAMTSPDKIADIVYIAKMKKAFNRGEFKLFPAVSPSHHDLLEAVCQGCDWCG